MDEVIIYCRCMESVQLADGTWTAQCITYMWVVALAIISRLRRRR